MNNFTNEQDLREDFVTPLLKKLGYSSNGPHRIEREPPLSVPKVLIGSNNAGPIKCYPDYVLRVNNKRKWVIETKSPKNIIDNEVVSQVYSYSINREVNVPYFVICNGKDFNIYKTQDQNYSPIISKKCENLISNIVTPDWEEIYQLFSVEAFKEREKASILKGEVFNKAQSNTINKEIETPIKEAIEPKKEQSVIHNGPHPYFTKRAWNVVREYIKHFCKEGGIVLDPYGGSGITAIESLQIGRKAIHIDINPIANFMTDALAIPVKLSTFEKEFRKIKKAFEKELEGLSKLKIKKTKYWSPKNVKLPKNASVSYLHEYFSDNQWNAMAILRNIISKIKNKNIRKVFFLIFSSTLVKCNKGFHNSARTRGISGGGACGLLKYYRFQIPKNLYPEQDPVQVFESKFKAMFKAKKQLDISQDFNYENLKIIQGSATNLTEIKSNSIDYVFTDPPYGSKINYLDCSIFWNAWLNLKVDKNMFEEEVISGGSKKKTDAQYINLLQKSLKEIHRVLKKDSWFSIVFASKNITFWHAIRDYCISIGFKYINTICQNSKRRTQVKNQYPLSVLKGEMILNFRKRSNKSIISSKYTPDISLDKFILNSAELTIVNKGGCATIDQIMADLIPKLLESGFVSAVSKEIKDFTKYLIKCFDCNSSGEWCLRKKTKLGCHIPLKKRMKIYLLSCLNRAKAENKKLTIEDIVFEVLPYLRNGITPSNQQIIKELRKIAISKDNQTWELHLSKQYTL